jgi:DnaJ-class molecular chaperone
MKDPYQILGLAKSASADEIKNTYRKLAKKFHPDLNPGNKEAELKFKDIAAAYEIVGTPENKAKFDRGEWEGQESPGSGRRGGPFYRQAQTGAGGRYDFQFEDFDPSAFEQMFGGGMGRGGGPSRPARDELYQMEIDLRDAISGADREISLPSGKRLQVKIPAGIAEGARLRFTGQGSPGFGGGPAADVYVEIHLREDSRFQRDGKNLQYELSVDIASAVLGGEARVPTPEGEVMLKIPKYSSSGKRIRIPGKGVFEKGDKARGDLVVALKIVVPEVADEELEAALKKWREKGAGA